MSQALHSVLGELCSFACLCFILFDDGKRLSNLKHPGTNLTLPSYDCPPSIFKVTCKYAEESCAWKKEIIFFIFLEIKPSFELVETCFMYYKLTVEHQECNIATDWLIVFDDQNKEGFPLWPAALMCQGICSFWRSRLRATQLWIVGKVNCCFLERVWFTHMFSFPPGMVCINDNPARHTTVEGELQFCGSDFFVK